MKNPSKSLHQLIHSLNKEEKKYFKKFSSFNIQQGSKNYVLLFDRINKMKEYDEEILKHHFKDKKFVNHFWKAKNYLYRSILKSLRSYHTKNIRELKTGETYDNLQLLLRKGLVEQCRKHLDAAKKSCYDYETYGELLKLLIFEKKLISSTRFSGVSDKDFRKLFDEINDTADKIKKWNEYQYNSTKLFELIKKKGSVTNHDDMKDIKEIIEQPIYCDDNNAQTFETKLSFYNAHYYFSYLSRDYEECYKYSLGMIRLFESSRIKMESKPEAYLNLLTNHIEVCLLTGRFDAFQIHYNKLSSLIHLSKNVFTYSIIKLNLELEYCIKTGMYSRGIKLVEKINPVLNSYTDEANEMRKCSLCYNVAYLYFLRNDYSNSLHYLNKILHNEHIKEELEVIYYARLLNLIIHYELRNFKLLQYILKSTYRFLSKRRRVFETEKHIYHFIRSAFRVDSEDELKYSFYELKLRLMDFTSNPFERGIFNYIDLISWLDSKLNNRQFSEVLIEKLKSSMINKKEAISF